MDIVNDIRIAMTVVTFLTFIGIVWFAYSRHTRGRFEEAAQLPFLEDDVVRPATNGSNNRGPQ